MHRILVSDDEIQNSLIEVEDHGCGNAYRRKECARAAAMACCDSPPVFEFSRHALGLVALFVKARVVFDLPHAIFLWRNAWPEPAQFLLRQTKMISHGQALPPTMSENAVENAGKF
ncbi:hypothetical protein [Varunaivibrio sulfuroxidans]|uniref:hypothetical protein n=1 Tax=Varunaivibrio sulfuroxidans TaxID=1773489 RepID=UPI00104945CD|nr:hypothetical protein [Varunaivibrio sulfuroxidans]WES29846.1 hypothetical protein P3M64_09340 [Varunaivibrio sulfuroxidans]